MKYDISNIPPSAIFCVQGEAIFSRLIRFWSRVVLGDTSKANHVGIYWGSGKAKTVEAVGFFVKKENFKRYLKKRFKIRVYAKKDLSLQELQILKAYSYGSVGRLYDWSRILKFIFKRAPDYNYMNTCVENVAQSYEYIKIKLPKLTPAGMEDFLRSKEGRKLGFKKIWQKD